MTVVTDSILELLYVMRAHLHHISGIITNKEVTPIWSNVAASKTQDGCLALLDHKVTGHTHLSEVILFTNNYP